MLPVNPPDAVESIFRDEDVVMAMGIGPSELFVLREAQSMVRKDTDTMDPLFFDKVRRLCRVFNGIGDTGNNGQ